MACGKTLLALSRGFLLNPTEPCIGQLTHNRVFITAKRDDRLEFLFVIKDVQRRVEELSTLFHLPQKEMFKSSLF